jgi:ABC-type multidrug transport system fused ATPase/permease subunit
VLARAVLLGAPLDAARYAAVLAACALLPDLTLLPAGDDTEIGEKGVNLSGGQRHRVALARAAYADADVYLLDDPLSAVDAHVGRHLFDACVLGLLRSKTRVLATHQLQYLPAADEVLVMREGRVAERGTHAELAARGVDFHELVMEAGQGEEAGAAPAEANGGGGGGGGGGTLAALAAGAGAAGGSRRASLEGGGAAAAAPSSPDDELVDVPLQDACVAAQTAAVELPPRPRPPPPPPPPPANGAHAPPLRSSSSSSPGGGASPRSPKIAAASAEPSPTTKEAAARRAASAQLTRAEERAVGRVDRRVYLRYFAAWGPAFLVPGAVLALGLTERGLQAGQNWWLSVWAEAMPGSGSADGAEGAAPGRPASFYMNVYFGLGFVSLGFQVVKAVVLVLGSVHAAGALQASLLATVLRLPMSFFDAQPTGRLLNRFTKDTEAVDTSLQSSISSFLNCAVRWAPPCTPTHTSSNPRTPPLDTDASCCSCLHLKTIAILGWICVPPPLFVCAPTNLLTSALLARRPQCGVVAGGGGGSLPLGGAGHPAPGVGLLPGAGALHRHLAGAQAPRLPGHVAHLRCARSLYQQPARRAGSAPACTCVCLLFGVSTHGSRSLNLAAPLAILTLSPSPPPPCAPAGHFSASLQGLPTLRAFRAQPRFEARNRALLDESNRAYWPAQCVNRWLSVRLELLGIGVVFGTAAAVSAAAPTSAGLAGLALTSALNLTGLMCAHRAALLLNLFFF